MTAAINKHDENFNVTSPTRRSMTHVCAVQVVTCRSESENIIKSDSGNDSFIDSKHVFASLN